MTNEEWNALKDQILLSDFLPVCLLVDGFFIRPVRRIDTRKMKVSIVLYIDGKVSHQHCLEDCEERRRFVYRKEKFSYSYKFRKEMAELNRLYRKLGRKIDHDPKRRDVFYSPFFPTFNAFRKQLQDNNKSIEWTNKPEQEKHNGS